MDAFTQTALGAAAAGVLFNHKLGRLALILGGAGGALPDGDFVLQQFAHPALPFEFHRHFTHSLLFIPVGGLIAALPFLLVPWVWKRRTLAIGAAIAGCATHALLDNCTSWGTMLLWPFTTERFAWDLLAIIDPFFSVPLFLAVLIALAAGSARAAALGLAWCLLYTAVAVVQHERADHARARLAVIEGRIIDRARVMPTLGNIIVWRSVERSGDRLYAEAIRVPLFAPAQAQPGTSSVRLATIDDLPPAARSSPEVVDVFDRFTRFADGWVGPVESERHAFGDMRYSLATGAFAPIWGVRIETAVEPQVGRWRTTSLRRDNRWKEDHLRQVFEGEGFVPLESAAPSSGKAESGSEPHEDAQEDATTDALDAAQAAPVPSHG